MAEPTDLQLLPRIDALLQTPSVRARLAGLKSEFVADQARALVSSWRARILSGELDRTALLELRQRAPEELIEAVQWALRPSLVPVLNGSGVVVHTNLGRAPWPVRAVEAATVVASGYSNLEMDLTTGRRGSRERHLGHIAGQLGGEAMLVVNNCAAAVLLTTNSLANLRETVVSRGELVEIGGSFRIPEIVSASGSRLREVGTTNRTRLEDYAGAINDETAVLLKVHPSNYRIVGFTETVAIEALARLGHEHDLAVVEDLGSGQLIDLAEVGLAGEPTVRASLDAGVDLVLFSGDKLLGGPQAGIILGSAERIDQLRGNPLYRALRPDKVVISALEEVLRIYLCGDPWRDIPVLASLAASSDGLLLRGQELAAELVDLGLSASVIVAQSTVGGGSAPQRMLPSPTVALAAPGHSVAAFESQLRAGDPPVVARIANDAVLLDLRAVPSDQDRRLIEAIAGAFARLRETAAGEAVQISERP